MVVGAKVCDLTEDLLWFLSGLYVGTLKSSLSMAKYPNLGRTPTLEVPQPNPYLSCGLK